MSDAALGGLSFAVLLGLMALRMPIGLAMFAVGGAGYVLLTDVGTFLSWLKSTPYYLFSNYTLSVIPLFILMGALAERAGLSRDLFRAAEAVIGDRRGGLAMAAIGACTAFGAICGSSVATTATMGRAALPELRRCGYDEAAGHRHARGRRHARHPDPAVDHPGHLRHRDRAEHRQAVHGGPGTGLARRDVLHRRHRLAGAPQPGSRPGWAEAVGRPSDARALVRAGRCC